MGNRIIGAVRQVIMLDAPDGSEENRRRLRVATTNSLKPSALGVTMGSDGNEYDTEPPLPAEEQPAKRGRPAHLEEDTAWGKAQLEYGGQRVSHLIELAEKAGISTSRLYALQRKGIVEEFVADGRKFWKLPEGQA